MTERHDEQSNFPVLVSAKCIPAVSAEAERARQPMNDKQIRGNQEQIAGEL